MAVHSTQLALRQALGTAGADVYTCPTGKRAIVKSILIRNTNVAASNCFVNVVAAGGTTAAFNFHLALTGADGDTINVATWIVLNAGDKLHVVPAKANVDLVISGAELIV